MRKIRANYVLIILLLFTVGLVVSCQSKESVNVVAPKTEDVVTRDWLLEIDGENKYAIWSTQNGADKSTLEFDLNNRTPNIPIVLGSGPPDGPEATVTVGDWSFNLIVLSYKSLDGAFNESGELKNGYFVQASTYDFDKDGNQEIILSIGNKKNELGIGIYKYGYSRFNQVGYIEGQAYSKINGDGIIETYNESGQVLEKYKWNWVDFIKVEEK